MLLLNLILRACIMLAGDTCPLYAFTTISMGGREIRKVWEVEGKQIHTWNSDNDGGPVDGMVGL